MRPHELERSPDDGAAGGEERHGRKLSSKLLEAFSLLCQTGKRFLCYIGEGRHKGASRLRRSGAWNKRSRRPQLKASEPQETGGRP